MYIHIYISNASIILLCISTAATPKQWEGLAIVWTAEAGYFIDTVINYDFTNQKLRYFGSVILFNNSSKPTSRFEEILLYNEVRIEADGVMLIYMLHDICGVPYEAMGLAGVHTSTDLICYFQVEDSLLTQDHSGPIQAVCNAVYMFIV